MHLGFDFLYRILHVTFTFRARAPTESNQFRLLAIERREKIGKWHTPGRKVPFLHCFSNRLHRIKCRTGVYYNRQKWPFFSKKQKCPFLKVLGPRCVLFLWKKVKFNFFGFIFVLFLYIFISRLDYAFIGILSWWVGSNFSFKNLIFSSPST